MGGVWLDVSKDIFLPKITFVTLHYTPPGFEQRTEEYGGGYGKISLLTTPFLTISIVFRDVLYILPEEPMLFKMSHIFLL